MRTVNAIALAFVATAASGLAAQRAEAAPSCKPPRVLVVLDKSSSMLGDAGGASKWSTATSALANVLNNYGGKADFGLMIFPSPNQCGPGAVKVSIGPATTQSILNQLSTPPPSGGNYTPMAQSLDAAPNVPELQDTTYANHVLLITDGWQWCDPYDASTRFLPVNSVSNLKALGITTHIVGFGDGVDTLTLNKMANAAGTKISTTCNVAGSDPKATDNCYYQANNPQQLLAALNNIAQKITQEVCDGIDNDCNGQVDDGLTGPSCPNQKGVCKGAVRTCDGQAGWSATCSDAAYQAAAQANGFTYEKNETLCDNIDNDCDGTVDEGCACVEGATRPCGVNTGTCVQGTQTCSGGQWGNCVGEVKPSSETCDGKDNDCNGAVDDKLTRPCQSACGSGTEVCTGGTWGACTAPEPSQEICDGLDNDCDGTVDGPDAICTNGGTCQNGVCVQAAPPPGGKGGCDCNVGSGEGATLPLIGLALLGLAMMRRRRRRRRSL
ncbi:MAG: VWA domain-containing protein [Myxococcales bacterium]|nr:VWA domain-containing protein [Myxococcales bacterium]